ncbi:hypothetical protein [Clostridium estertheticum]|uniref:hypothetical protein n=1 Tax=Clostridium estertheticum TaxID=238834 RepID=UPI00124D8ED7|nr:hypothetical protein [Clostridium estertheticum]MBU3171329.1 hypothetical protein [Clostridium estertheticum]MBZ9615270.1 hypothetical protein [Clostridium estertheticum subsp. laramiense]WAG75159.1 hypothetical protein LL032_06840 [Clostridium estertheticum]
MKNKKLIILSLLCFTLFTLIGCSSGTKSTSSNVAPTVTKTKPVKVKLTAKLIFNKFKETEKAHITKIEMVTAENDQNKLLGRPNQYTEKICWSDGRLKDSQTVSSIEVFNNKVDATARKTYIETISKSMPMLTQYLTVKDNILLRIESGLTPVQSEEYIKVFKSM